MSIVKLMQLRGHLKLRVLGSDPTGKKRHLGVAIEAKSRRFSYPVYITIDTERGTDEQVYEAIELSVLKVLAMLEEDERVAKKQQGKKR